MGIGTSMKETTLHYYRDPILEVVSEDEEVNLRGIVIVGSPDSIANKYRSSERVGVTLEAMKVDGAIFSCNGIGNNHVDYAKSIEETEKRGIPVVGLSVVPASDFVVQNNYMDSILCFNSKKGEDVFELNPEVLAQNTVTKFAARKALVMLKLRMRKIVS